MPRFPECDQLNTYRLDQDWTFAELAADMAKAKYPVPMRTLHYILTAKAARPLDRTLYKIRKYVEVIQAKGPRSRKRIA